MIAQSKAIQDKILDIKYGRVKEGLKIGVPEIDEYIRYKQGEFFLLIGHANVGKTTIVCYLLTLWAIKHNLRFLVWSSENTPQSIVRKIIEFKMGTPIHQAEEKDIADAVVWCDKHFKIIDVEDLYTYKDLMKEANAVKDAWDYDGLLIDPYNSLAKDHQLLRAVGSHEYDYQVASELRLFAKKKNVTVFLNAHGVTESLRRTHPKGHEYENLPMPLGLAGVEGGGKWGNRSDSVYSIHRYTSHPSDWMYSHIHVLKVKENETGGRCTPYEQPISLRMALNNVGFEYKGQDLLNYKELKQIQI
jgi:energy-coupling factor transporter ATP-binding protein EcfA2